MHRLPNIRSLGEWGGGRGRGGGEWFTGEGVLGKCGVHRLKISVMETTSVFDLKKRAIAIDSTCLYINEKFEIAFTT